MIKNLKDKLPTILEGIILLSLLLYCAITIVYYWNWEFAHDGHAFLYLAKHIEQLGRLSYRDIIEINTIGSHLVYFFIGKIFGFSIMGLRIADLFLMAGIGTLIYRLLEGYRPVVRLITIFSFLSLYLASWPKHYMQREYICLLPLLGCIYIAANRSQAMRNRFLQVAGMGILIGLAVAIKPTMILFIPVIVWCYYRDDLQLVKAELILYSSLTLITILLPIFYSILIKFVELDIYNIGRTAYYGLHFFTIAFCIALIIRIALVKNNYSKEVSLYFLTTNLIALACGAYLYFSGSLDYFIKIAIETWPFYFKLDTTLDDAMTPLKKFHIGLHNLLLVGDYWPLGFGILFGMYLSFQEKVKHYKLILVYGVTSFAVVLFAFKFFPYHFFPFLLFGVLAMAPFFDLKNKLYQVGVYKMVGGLIFGGIFLSLLLIGGQGAIYAKINDIHLKEASNFLINDIKKSKQENISAQPLGWVQMGALKVMDSAGFFLPTKYMYTMELYHHVEHPIVKRKQVEFLESIKKVDPTYLIEEPAPSFIYEKSSPEQLYPSFEKYKKANYEVVYPKLRERTKLTIWKKKTAL